MRKRLFFTHKVNLVGQKDLGCFFAERLDGQTDGIFLYEKSGMLLPRPWLSDKPIEWHLFNERYILPEDRYWHGFPLSIASMHANTLALGSGAVGAIDKCFHAATRSLFETYILLGRVTIDLVAGTSLRYSLRVSEYR
jgi:hypothetical protein